MFMNFILPQNLENSILVPCRNHKINVSEFVVIDGSHFQNAGTSAAIFSDSNPLKKKK